MKKNFKLKLIRGDKEIHFILIMEVVNQEDITLLNTYEPNFGMPNFIYKEITLLQ